MAVEFHTNLIWSATNELGVKLFLEHNKFENFCVYEDIFSQSTLPFIIVSVTEKDWMYLRLKYSDVLIAINEYINDNRKILYQRRINQLYERVESGAS